MCTVNEANLEEEQTNIHPTRTGCRNRVSGYLDGLAGHARLYSRSIAPINVHTYSRKYTHIYIEYIRIGRNMSTPTPSLLPQVLRTFVIWVTHSGYSSIHMHVNAYRHTTTRSNTLSSFY